MPNTYAMQELIRENYDYYNELKGQGKDVECPFIFRIPKGELYIISLLSYVY